jgi:FMN phosphatase YigB (HAD superfamily)
MSVMTSSGSIHELCRLIDGCGALSLDVFDTAILRRVAEPVHVFALVQRHYRQERRGAVTPFDFARERVAAERRARDQIWFHHRRGEITLDEIYQQLEAPPDWERDQLRRLELDAERALCARNEYIHAAYEHARRRGKRTLFTSDMYLPADFIAAMLRDCGYEPDGCLYVSSACGGATKHSGALYRHVAAELAIDPGRVLHIGDNPFSDVAMALRNGVSAVLYERCAVVAERARPAHVGDGPAASIYRGLTRNRLYARRGFDALGFWYRFGFEVLGVLLAGFDGDAGDALAAFGGDPVVAALLQLAEPDARVLRLREGARDFLVELEVVRARWPWLEIDPWLAQAPMRRVLERPTAEEAHELGELPPPDGAAPNALVRPPRLLEAVQDPRAAWRSYARSPWRAGYRARWLRQSLALS